MNTTKSFKNRVSGVLIILSSVVILSSCGSNANIFGRKDNGSRTIGWDTNHPIMGGLANSRQMKQEKGPGLVYIEGGTFVMGQTNDDLIFGWSNVPQRVSVPSFYMDETEVTNRDYLKYVEWTYRIFGQTHPEKYLSTLPDTLLWTDPNSYNEPFLENYLRHPAFADYPVVGVSWLQANDYAAWRTDRVNEWILVREGILEWDPDQNAESHFTTRGYLYGEYEGLVRENLEDLDPRGTGTRRVRWEDGLLLPRYRLPTEAEWEYAALGHTGQMYDETVADRRVYPWEPSQIRSQERRTAGQFQANFQRGRGDFVGVTGYQQSAGSPIMPVYSFWPNDFGLYNMLGNVNEWVQDIYRPLPHQATNDYHGARTRQQQEQFSENGLVILNGNDNDMEEQQAGYPMARLPDDYYANAQGLINNQARVYKGGSWKDRIHWLTPGTRRYLDQNKSANDIGFRCAMDLMGTP